MRRDHDFGVAPACTSVQMCELRRRGERSDHAQIRRPATEVYIFRRGLSCRCTTSRRSQKREVGLPLLVDGGVLVGELAGRSHDDDGRPVRF